MNDSSKRHHGIEAASVPGFLCDEMLKRLGRWLRAAGYDTLIQEGPGRDRDMLRRARDQNRLLLTRDRKLLEFRLAPGTVIHLRANSLEDCIEELTQKLALDWHYRPFSRCLLCNTPLVAADAACSRRIPEDVRRAGAVRFCPRCHKPYWEGGHVRRMRKRLEQWRVK